MAALLTARCRMRAASLQCVVAPFRQFTTPPLPSRLTLDSPSTTAAEVTPPRAEAAKTSTSLLDLSHARVADHDALRRELVVMDDLVTLAEAQHLVADISCIMDELPLRDAHFDGLISNFREFHTGLDATMWSTQSRTAIERIRTMAKSYCTAVQPEIHVIELPQGAHILPHFDSVKFTGRITVGVNLNCRATIRFSDADSTADLMLAPGSVYVMSGIARYVYKHEVLPTVVREGCVSPRGRRFSLIQRDAGPCSHLPIWKQYLHGVFPLPPTSEELLKQHRDWLRERR